ncbi:replication-associated recombination protein A [Candidatus Dojkabacteria bacterium]|jgi:putative ATPase|nr:replication-associated recombination protein A [Candidatus Dojkabacteria bacterium]
MNEPLASRYRPKTLSDFVGQKHLTGEGKPISLFLKTGNIPSMLFWGPPGTGKTTLAYIISQDMFYDFHKLQAVASGKEALNKIIKIAQNNLNYGRKTILFLDEIHRWNKAQQDALLPYVEKGTITLIGATTENPSFRINNALLSRCKVFVFEPHNVEDIIGFLKKVIKQEFKGKKIKKSVIDLMADLANGDLRSALNILEMSSSISKESKEITEEDVKNAVQKQLYYDRAGDEHYNLISAVHKSLRSSNPDAACYYIMRMLEGGEDPLYIARRLLRFSSEDIGNANPNAILLANTVYEACAKIGMPECDVFLMQLAIYLAKSKKDNSTYVVAQETRKDIKKLGNLPIPKHMLNAPTKLMEELEYGKGYEYDPDLESKHSNQQCMPDKLKNKKYIR